ncbi:ferredoxin [Streptococcus pantholopis]|uniref:Ferredoxin n=1 Tax=Streptococcus pantholopis TaxID=1811193 RepID=A0A172Q6P6_9STRE|nr:ferredoxin [Streptococcus pantholopis]AND79159.1 ferredoxin [Streptococcus pantholopis]
MKVVLIPEKCIACGLCQTYSKLFDYDDDGIVKFSDSSELVKTINSQDQNTLKAVKACPTKALTIL